MRQGVLLAVLQLMLAGSVVAKFWLDRTILPRGWARAVPFDPYLPVRGRYVRLALEVESPQPIPSGSRVALSVSADRLAARVDDNGLHTMQRSGKTTLAEAVAFFIPEHIPDPSVRRDGEELWVQVSVPAKGPPRPIQLAINKGGVLTPLEIR